MVNKFTSTDNCLSKASYI